MSYHLTNQQIGPVVGSIVKARSPWPRPDHDGIIGIPLSDGRATVIDNTRDGVQARNFEEFADGRRVDYVWVPDSPEQQDAVLNRAYSQLGQPYKLFSANCEHFVSWVVTGVPDSPQLKKYIAGAGIFVLGLWGLWGLGGETA
jgi:hypothetical protein